ncbi:MAG: glycosyltransferase family 52 [Bacteroidota bacterium]
MGNNNTKPGHLFICYTPLHALIAKKVIEKEQISSFILVFYYHVDSEKIRHYFGEISAKAKKAFYIKKNNNLLHTIKVLFGLFFNLKRQLGAAPIVYTGNVKSIYSRFLIYALRTKTLHTFDDGIGNVSGEGYFYKGLTPGAFSKITSVFGLNFSYSWVYGLIRKHYTIYKMENVMPFCEYISLFDFESGGQTTSNHSSTAVLLTSTMCEDGFISLDFEKKLYKTVIADFNVRYVIAHPLEMHDKCSDQGVTIIKSEKIAEDIIIDLKKQYGSIKVIGWYSSALIHLLNVNGVETVNIHFESNLSLGKTKQFFESHQVKTYTPNLKAVKQ